MTISKATPVDITELVSLINSAYRGESSKKGWTNESHLLGGVRIDAVTLEQMLNKENATMLKFINENNSIEGCVYLEKKVDKLYLGMLTVSPGQQAKGIGKKLLYAAEAFARDHNYTIIQMTVISVREELIKWYERHGYVNTGEIRPFPTEEKFRLAKQALQFTVMKKEIAI